MQSTIPRTYSITAVILIVGCLVGVYMILTNFYPAYTSAKLQQENEKAENVRLTRALASVQTFLNSFKEQEVNVAKVNLALPSEHSDMANFVNLLPQIASASGIILTDFQVANSKETNYDEYSIVPQQLSMSLTGSYLSFKDFMSRLQRNLRIVDVDQVSLNSSTTGGAGTPQLIYQISLKTYYQQ